MAFVDVAIAVGSAVGLEGGAAILGGGAIIGAGTGAAYSAITGDGNILNSALTGGLIGGAGAYGLGAMGAGSAATQAAMAGPFWGASAMTPAQLAAANTNTPAMLAAANASADPIAALNSSAMWTGEGAAGANAVAGGGSALGSTLGTAGSGLTAGQMLGYGLAGSAALSLLGNAKTPKLSAQAQGQNPSYIRPYTYNAGATGAAPSVSYNSAGLPVLPATNTQFFNPSFTAQPVYKAAQGGLTPNVDFMGDGAYPMSQQTTPHYAVPSQMPVSAQQTMASYEEKTNPLTGQPVGFDAGGTVDLHGTFSNGGQGQGGQGGLGSLVGGGFNSAPNPYGNFAQGPVPQGGYGFGGPATADIRNPDQQQNGYPTAIQTGELYAPPQYMNMPLGGPIQFNKGGKAEDEEFSFDNLPKAKKEYLLDLMANSMTPPKMPGSDVGSQNSFEKYMMSQMPQGAFGRVGGTKILDDDSSVRAGMSGMAMAVPGKHGVTTMPGSFDVGYNTRAGNGNVDLSAFRSINPIPGRGHAQGLNARYTLPFAEGGSLGGYSDGGRMLKGPGDGMSDSIPASISNKQPARLADGEFVVPADVVSHLGNGSTDAGAKRLYAMMDKVRKARTGTKKQGKHIKAEKYLPT